jgi:hypothetical protein
MRIEFPTPRWTGYDARRYGTKMAPKSPNDHARVGVYVADLERRGAPVNAVAD